MIAGEQSGDRGAAIKLYDRFAERLRQELKATPSAETTAIYRRLKAETVNA
jgi:DNA-binding SARP family transcriptional activator